MSDKYYPSRKDLSELIHNICLKSKLDADYLETIVQKSKNWETEILILSYFTSKILQKFQKNNSNQECKELLIQIYDIENQLFATYEDLDREFIEYMLCHKRMDNSLEDNILFLLERYKEHNYEFIIRN
jgi:hypothetical protein